ncbi:MAG: IPT/TIG domain-containing protein [Actinomycetota bacterium]
MKRPRFPVGRWLAWLSPIPVAILILGVAAAPAQATTFSNTTSITIPDSGLFSPYPSTIAVSGLTGTITKVTVTLHGFTTFAGQDIDVIVIGPDGNSYAVLLADSYGDAENPIDLTFDDLAATTIPQYAGWATGTYRPTVLGSYFIDTSNTNSSLSIFNGESANGDWNLYGGDDTPSGGASSFAGGWSLHITTAPTPTPTPSPGPVAVTSFSPTTGRVGDAVTITGTGFIDATAVKFGGTPAATFTVDSPTQISAKVPAGAGTGSIAVIGPAGTGSSTSDFVVDHARNVSLTLAKTRANVKAKGRVNVDDGFVACRKSVPVKIQHREHGKWKTVEATLTNDQGTYTAPGVSKKGKYRSLAKETTLSSGDVCLGARSPGVSK